MGPEAIEVPSVRLLLDSCSVVALSVVELPDAVNDQHEPHVHCNNLCWP
jgi:hypothetical protein